MISINLFRGFSNKLFNRNSFAGLISNYHRSLSTTHVSLQQAVPDLNILSDLTDYVNRQLFLYTPEEPKEKALTTAGLLNNCQSVDEVLHLVKNMHRSNMLWKDELMLYHNAIVSLTNEIIDKEERQQTIMQILNNRNFHILLRSTAISSIYMLTNHLAQFLYI